MIKQLASKDVEDYIKNNPKSVLIDVRTEKRFFNDFVNKIKKFVK